MRIILALVILSLTSPTFAAIKKQKASAKLYKEKTKKFKYDYSKINSVPFSFHDMGMSDAEFFITDKPDTQIQDEIDRVQGSISELEYTTSISYEPRYLNQKPQTKNQKTSYLKGYLKVLEEAIL